MRFTTKLATINSKTLISYRFTIWTVLLLTNVGPAVAEHRPTDLLNDLPDRKWMLVDLGGVTAPLGILAYSGGWYDPDAHQFCIFGGGHYNYSGNEVWCFDIAALKWREMYPADVVTDPPYNGADQGAYNNYDNENYPGALFHPAGEGIADARPMSRHSYDQLEYVNGYGAVAWGGYTWGDSQTPWCNRCMDTWVFNFADAAWTFLYNGKNPSPNEVAGSGASAYSSRDGILFAKVLQETWSYDPKKNTWRKLSTRGNPPWSIEGTLEYDPTHSKLYYFGGNYEVNHTLWEFDIPGRRWQSLQPKGSGPNGESNNGPGLAYDTKNDVLAVYFGGTIWIYDVSAEQWETIRPDVRPTDSSYVFGRFRYDPVNNGFWLHASEDGRHATWFFRYQH